MAVLRRPPHPKEYPVKDLIERLDPVEAIIKNSYKNFHTRGLDYICLRRSAHQTVKAYMFDGDENDLSEVVNPHDHRYNFDSYVLAGEVRESKYIEAVDGSPVRKREWLTPLNGGQGFGDDTEAFLKKTSSSIYNQGARYSSRANEVHTLHILSGQSLVIITQHEDVLPIGVPTSTYFQGDDKPSLNGLYEQFNADDILKRTALIQSLIDGER